MSSSTSYPHSPFLRLLAKGALVLLASFAAACMSNRLHPHPRNATDIDSAISQIWAKEIKRVARTGDIILTRSYSNVGDAIVNLTSGKEFSHASIYNAETGMVIEAIRPGVRELPLEQFLGPNHYAVLIRPQATSEAGAKAYGRAKSAVGAEFDIRGLVGIGSSERFYCSELVAWAWELEEMGLVVTPAELYEVGEMVYLSGERDDPQLLARAVGSLEFDAKTRVASNNSP